MTGTVEPTEAEREAIGTCIARAFDAKDEEGKAGIAAVILRDGVEIARGDNRVFEETDATRHAEIVAMSRAMAALDRTDLEGCTLVTSLQPCEMCLSAMRFAKIDRVVFAARQENVAAKYFMFGKFGIADFHAASGAAFDWAGGVEEAAVLPLYAGGDDT